MVKSSHKASAMAILGLSAMVAAPGTVFAQIGNTLFPDRSFVPALLAGARDPTTSFSPLLRRE